MCTFTATCPRAEPPGKNNRRRGTKLARKNGVTRQVPSSNFTTEWRSKTKLLSFAGDSPLTLLDWRTSCAEKFDHWKIRKNKTKEKLIYVTHEYHLAATTTASSSLPSATSLDAHRVCKKIEGNFVRVSPISIRYLFFFHFFFYDAMSFLYT